MKQGHFHGSPIDSHHQANTLLFCSIRLPVLDGALLNEHRRNRLEDQGYKQITVWPVLKLNEDLTSSNTCLLLTPDVLVFVSTSTDSVWAG